MKRRNDLSLGEAIRLMLREYQLDGRLKDFQVRAIWQRLMEKELGNYISEVRVREAFTATIFDRAASNYISEVRVREGVLYVKVLSSPLRQELTIAREKIRERLNEEMGEPYVREVVIR
jgi:hypothetical protein